MAENTNRYCEISYGVRPNASSDYDTKQTIFYFFQKEWDGKIPTSVQIPASYQEFFDNDNGEIGYLMINDAHYNMKSPTYGMYKIPANEQGNNYSIYKKEVADGITYYSPVAVNTSETTIIDFKI